MVHFTWAEWPTRKMKPYFLFTILIFTSLSSQSQDLNVTSNIASFEYRCEGTIGSRTKEENKLKVKKFKQKDGNVILEMIVATNCADSYRGQVVLKGDTLKIFDNNTQLVGTTYDSLTQETLEVWETETLFCWCVSHYFYKFKGIKPRINVVSFHDECVSVK